MADLLPLDEAVRTVLAHVRPLPAERVPLAQAAGRVLAEPVRSTVDLPPFPSSAMDGFAVRAADVPGTLPVTGRIAAGRPAERALRGGEAMAIATGGSVPEGADSVVPVELVVEQGNEIEVATPVEAGTHVRPRGGDLRRGEIVVEAGELLSPAQVGALAAAGAAGVICGARPRAAVVATGTELRPPGEALADGEIYEANSYLLAAALESVGAVVERLPAAVDDEDAHRAVLARALESDVVVSSGGVSVGPHDLVRRVAAALGVEEVFWGVAVKPGKPASFGVRGRTLVFGLPGNPVSTLVGCRLFVLPAVLALQGAGEPGPRFLRARLASALRRNASRDELVRARTLVDGEEMVAEPLRGQESHMIARAAAADALVLVSRGEGELPAGAVVPYLPL